MDIELNTRQGDRIFTLEVSANTYTHKNTHLWQEARGLSLKILLKMKSGLRALGLACLIAY